MIASVNSNNSKICKIGNDSKYANNCKIGINLTIIRSSIFHLSPLLEKALSETLRAISFMASSLLERPRREKELGERSEPRLCLVEHPQMVLAIRQRRRATLPPERKCCPNYLLSKASSFWINSLSLPGLDSFRLLIFRSFHRTAGKSLRPATGNKSQSGSPLLKLSKKARSFSDKLDITV